MPRKQFLSILAFFLYSSAFSQSNDSVFFVIKKAKGQSPVYDVAIKNLSGLPICLLHAVDVNLNLGDTISLAAVKFQNSMAFFSLNKPVVDDNIIYEGNGNSISASSDADIILPQQVLYFKIAAPMYNDEEVLVFEYAFLNNFCYKAFRDSIFRNTAEWYKIYKMEKANIVIPTNWVK